MRPVSFFTIATLFAAARADSSSGQSSISSAEPGLTTIDASSNSACPLSYTTTVTSFKTVAESTYYNFSTTVTISPPETRTVIVFIWQSYSTYWPYSSTQSQSTGSVDPNIASDCLSLVKTYTKRASVTQTGSTRTITGSTLFIDGKDGFKTTTTITSTISNLSSPLATTAADTPSSVTQAIGEIQTAPTAPETVIATGTAAFSWNVTTATAHVSLSVAPTYTSLPDGVFSAITSVISSVITNQTSNASMNGSTDGQSSTGIGIVPSTVPIMPKPGDIGSNVTAPFPPLAEVGCNTAVNRQLWCNGKDILSDYYTDYISGNKCQYDFTITNELLDLDGNKVPVLAVNGQVPGPMIECNWGDMVSVTVHNHLVDNGTSFHWHGMRQLGTNNMDGVPGVTECPLAPGESRAYTWLASSYGSSWYHSHWTTQYGDGLYGPMVIHGPASANYDVDAGVVLISDTFPTSANLYNSIITHQGPKGTTNYLLNGHNTKADLSAGQHSLWKVQKGKKYLFRFVNSASQNMYSVSLDNHQMQVIAADFVPIKPYTTSWLNIGIGQRYDVIIEMNQDLDSYFLRAVTQLMCPSSCNNTGLGQANGIVAYEGVQEAPYLLPTSATTKTISDFNICDDEPLASMVPYVKKSAGSPPDFTSKVATLPAGNVKFVTTNDDGNIVRWYLNGGALNLNFTQPSLLTLAGQQNTSALVSNYVTLPTGNIWVYFIIQNQFFAGHPMHLHGHDFSILGQGLGQFNSSMVDTLNFDNPMRRDTAMLMGRDGGTNDQSGYTVIGFETDNPGAWLMHCHIIWHVEAGLSLQWLERPDEIPAQAYVDSSFNETCAAYAAYEAQSPSHNRLSWESGVKL